eukprot:RCo011964
MHRKLVTLAPMAALRKAVERSDVAEKAASVRPPPGPDWFQSFGSSNLLMSSVIVAAPATTLTILSLSVTFTLASPPPTVFHPLTFSIRAGDTSVSTPKVRAVKADDKVAVVWNGQWVVHPRGNGEEEELGLDLHAHPFGRKSRVLAYTVTPLKLLPLHAITQHRIDFGFGILTVTLRKC